MSKSRGRKNTPCTVVLCRGCCCGTLRKQPDVDHVAQLRRLRVGLSGHAILRTSDCLGACEHANIAVVLPGRSARARGARPLWLGGLADAASEDSLIAWVRDGGPGTQPCPLALSRLGFRPSRRAELPK